MDYSNNPPIEQVYVVRMANCIRLYNAIHNPPKYFGISDDTRARFEKDLKEFGEERRQLEQQIGEKHRLNYYAYKKIINDLYAEMNEADKGFVMGQGSPMWQRLDEFITKFTDAINGAKEAQP